MLFEERRKKKISETESESILTHSLFFCFLLSLSYLCFVSFDCVAEHLGGTVDEYQFYMLMEVISE